MLGSAAVAAEANGLRDVAVVLEADVAAPAEGAVADAGEELAAAMGSSAEANNAASIIGAIQVPEYAESAGMVAQEPDRAASYSVAAGSGASLAAGGVAGLTAAAREPVVAESCVGAMPLRTPLGESADEVLTALRTPLGEESADDGATPLRTPLGESADVAEAALRTLLAALAAAEAKLLCVPLGESGAPALGAVPGAFEVAGLGPTEARLDAFAAAGLLPGPAAAGRVAEGIPNPAGDPAFWASEVGVAFAGAAVLADAGCTDPVFGWLATTA